MGEYGGFDRLAAAVTRRMIQKYLDITLMLVLPYHPAERPTEAPDGFDGTYHPEGLEDTPKWYAIVRANRIMVDACDWLVCYVRHGAGNSRKLLEYAQKLEARRLIQIENIGESRQNKETRSRSCLIRKAAGLKLWEKKEGIPLDHSSGILSVSANTFLTMCRVRICVSW